MKKLYLFVLLLGTTLSLHAQVKAEAGDNKLTKEEIRDGWQLLFDGQTTTGWRSAKAQTFPKGGWEVANGNAALPFRGRRRTRNRCCRRSPQAPLPAPR